jgi:peptide/nickel transport system permease protein
MMGKSESVSVCNGSRIEQWKKELQPISAETKYSLHLVRTHPLALAGLVIIMGLIVVALLAPWLSPYDPVAVNLSNKLLPPSHDHIFGTDEMGRDILSRVIAGSRISLRIAITVVAFAFTFGTTLGTVAGFYGGAIDEILMRITDMFLSIPALVLALVIAAALGPSLYNLMLSLCATWWPWYTRLVRGETLSVREKQYVESARMVGLSDLRLLFRHILPNCLAPVIINASMDMGYVILTAAGLSFIGLGAQPPSPEWGAMLSFGRNYMQEAWWLATFPGLAILTTVLGFNLLGDGLRDILDPKLRR